MGNAVRKRNRLELSEQGQLIKGCCLHSKGLSDQESSSCHRNSKAVIERVVVTPTGRSWKECEGAVNALTELVWKDEF